MTLRELVPELGLGWVEKDLQPYDAVNADEAWLTSTPYLLGTVYAHQQYADWRRQAWSSIPSGDGGVESAGGDGRSGAA